MAGSVQNGQRLATSVKNPLLSGNCVEIIARRSSNHGPHLHKAACAILKPSFLHPLLLAGLALLLALAVIGLMIFSDDDHYELEIPLADIPLNKVYYRLWNGQQLLIVQPDPTLLQDQRDSQIKKSRVVVDPPARTDRDQYPIKVFLLDRSQSYLMFGYQKWYNAILPCAAFHYIDQPFLHDDQVIAGGFKCSRSLDDFWQDKLVFNLFGRAQDPEVPDMYSPWYRVVGDTLVIGMK